MNYNFQSHNLCEVWVLRHVIRRHVTIKLTDARRAFINLLMTKSLGFFSPKFNEKSFKKRHGVLCLASSKGKTTLFKQQSPATLGCHVTLCGHYVTLSLVQRFTNWFVTQCFSHYKK